ncbi:phage Gp37/Gp68 family protein [soil metagenome]
MGENTAIEWATHTFNPWEGCQKVGPGCEHCYAEARNARFGGGVAANWGPGAPRRRTSTSNWAKPLKWQTEARRTGIRPRVFCASLADVFDNAVDPQWRDDLWRLILDTPDLDWLLLTKRIGNVPGRTPIMGIPANAWLGVTVVNQAEADRDVPKLLAVPAARRFLSIEPMLGEIQLVDRCNGWFFYDALRGDRWHDGPCHDAPRSAWAKIDWVICGGESGHGARPMHPDWARTLREQCAAAGTPFLFKQWGEFGPYNGEPGVAGFWLDPNGSVYQGPTQWPPNESESRQYMVRWGKKAAGRLLDGVQHDGLPG